MPDAIVIGSGPNGLVAANLLADEGWDVLVLEAAGHFGGAVKSSELIEPGFINDHFSAFYPLGAASPVIKALELEKYGLIWKHSPLVLAHPSADGTCPILSMDIDETAASLDGYATGDGDAWRKMYRLWEASADQFLQAVFTPFPPVKASLRLLRTFPAKELARLARFMVLPVRKLGDEQFGSPQSRRLLAGLALHGDLLPESTLSGFYGWLLAVLGQSVGFPVPEGGAGQMAQALVNRLESKGGKVLCNQRVTEIDVRRGRACGVRTANDSFAASRAVLANVDAPSLYTSLLSSEHVPSRVLRDIKRFQWDHATVKIDWNLDGTIPWTASDARRAGTVHIADSMDELSVTSSELARGLIPKDPFLLFGQQSMTDPTRAPAGKETAWAYTHVPVRPVGDNGGSLTGKWDEAETGAFVERMEARVEALAPGFRNLIRGRHVFNPLTLQDADSNLHHGALGGGTSELHQQLVFRPVPGLARPETPVERLYLASASAHPGGGVHGAPGANAAAAAIKGWKRRHAVRAVRWVAAKRTESADDLVP